MKRIVLIVMLCLLTVGAFAQGTAWAKSYNKDGQFNIYASIGYAWGFTGSLGLEFIITEFKIGNIPFDFGVAARGAIEAYQSWYYTGTDVFWGAAPMATLHMGLASIPIEFYISAGLAIYGWSWSGALPYGFNEVNVGFASLEGMVWHFSPNFGLILEAGYLGYVLVWGIGLEVQL
jgi:hypothetical protein